MSEKQIRDILRDVCHDLDRHSRRVVRDGVRKLVLPTVLGAGLALSGCGDDATKSDTGATQKDTGAEVGAADMAYMGPDAGPPPKDAAGKEAGKEAGLPDLMYMGPDVGPDKGPMPPYMAPEAGTLYMAPDAKPLPPDGLPVPPYMAPDAKSPPPAVDGGSTLLYMAPNPDKGTP